MITKFKIFENINEDPEEGDYVICKDKTRNDEILNNFLSNNIGTFIGIDDDRTPPRYYVNYYNIPDIKGFRFNDIDWMRFNRNEIIYFSKNKKDCEAYIASKKFNL